MGKPKLDPLKIINFRCQDCGRRFESEPDSVESDPDKPWHPWSYQCECSNCGGAATQIWWQQNLLKGWAEATGPTSDEGIRRSRFNAITHGLSARVAAYYPAKPGGYPHCQGCLYLDDMSCLDYGGCLRRTELMLRHLVAYEHNNPQTLQQLHAERQGHIAALADDMLLAIIQDGVRLKTPMWYHDKDGDFRLAQYINKDGEEVQLYELSEHPLLKRLFDLVQKNNMTLSDQGMTPKVQDDQAAIRGQLAEEADDVEVLADYARRQADAIENLAEMIESSRKEAEKDPILLEHQAGEPDQGFIDG